MNRILSSAVNRHRQNGLSLIELMVSLVIGSFLISGAVFVYMQSRNSFTTNDVMARLQETARYAFSVIEPDVRMSSFWGLVNDPDLVIGRAAQTAVGRRCRSPRARDLGRATGG